MNTSTRTMRINIAGSWRAEDMANALLAVRDLYNLRLSLEVIKGDMNEIEEYWYEWMEIHPFRRSMKRRHIHPLMFQMPYSPTPNIPIDSDQLAKLAEFVLPNEELRLSRIEYASPGFSDLAGVGDIVGHVKDFIVRIVELWVERPARKRADERAEVEIEGMRLDNARKFVAIAKECGYTDAEIRRMTVWVDDRQETIIDLVRSGMIQSTHLLDDNPNLENER